MIMMDKNEKYLKSIDNTLKDILKELKRQNSVKATIAEQAKQIGKTGITIL